MIILRFLFLFFFFNDTATTEIYTLSLHDALPIYQRLSWDSIGHLRCGSWSCGDRKSTRLNSSHVKISYAVFCLKKKKKQKINTHIRRTNNRLTGKTEMT